MIPLRAWVLIGVCSALFFLLAADVKLQGPVSKLDRPISQTFHDLGTAKRVVLQGATELGDGGVVERFTWALAVVLILIRRWHYLPALLFTIQIGFRINARMQNFFARPRPRFEDMGVLTHPGFPSGHTTAAVLIFGFLILLAFRELSNKPLRVFAISLAALCILLVGFTRVALLVHYPTDVLGSFLWCTAWLVGCYYANIAAYRWSARNMEPWAIEKVHTMTPI